MTHPYQLSGCYYILKFLETALGKPGPLKLNTQIVEHGWWPEEPAPKEIILTIGRANTPITVKQVHQAFKKLKQSDMRDGRSYFLEGIRKATVKERRDEMCDYYLVWGS